MLVSDPDGDLTTLATDVYLDQTIDGFVDDSTLMFAPILLEVDAGPCEATEVGLQLQLGIPPEAALEYGADLEVGIIISDAKGNPSAMGIGSGCLPNEDGSDC